MHSSQNAKVSLIIPAFNERATIAGIVSIALKNPLIGEIIVVDDGSSDNTGSLAEQAGAKIIRLAENIGKAGAMDKGFRASRYEIICFLDGDIRGFTPGLLDQIIAPVSCGKYQMFIGILARKSRLANVLLAFLPKLGGCRAIVKGLWLSIPEKYKRKYQIEMAMNFYAKKLGRKAGYTIFEELRQDSKEKKWGLLIGLYLRALMIINIIYIAVRLYFFENLKIMLAKFKTDRSF